MVSRFEMGFEVIVRNCLTGYIIMLLVTTINSETLEVCTAEELSITCPSDKVILVTSAEYGRREMGRCITKQEGHMGCSTDVLPLLDRWCSGRKECRSLIPVPELEALNKACLDYLKMYLKVEYICLSVEVNCASDRNILKRNEGIISSHVASQTGCGSSRSPWKIFVSAGKTVNMTMFDFSGKSESQGQGYVTCKYIYGYVLERSLGINHTICGGGGREVALYKSKTNNVDVHLTSQSVSADSYFLIKYTAHGCSELTRPANAWYKREGNEAVIGCETNDQEWRLTCTGNTWHGTVGNCSSTESGTIDTDQISESDMVFGLNSVIIMTGIACGVVVAVVIAVMLGVIYIKKYKMKQETKRIHTTYATMDRLGFSQYRPVSNKPITPTMEAPSERLVDVPGTWIQPDTFSRQGTVSSYPDPCTCQSLPGSKRQHGGFGEPGNYEMPKFPNP